MKNEEEMLCASRESSCMETDTRAEFKGGRGEKELIHIRNRHV
jgi:hypothetical protein